MTSTTLTTAWTTIDPSPMQDPTPQSRRLFRAVVALSTVLVAGCLARLVGFGAEPATQPANAVRTPWTTSRVLGSPDPPPPFKVVRAFPNLKFDRPLLLARCPGSDRLFVGEQAGVIYSFRDAPEAKAELFCDLRQEIKTIHELAGAKEVEAVYGL